jgi:predicted metal-dependent peptidase
MQYNEDQRLKRAHVALMKHQETALYSGIIMMGKSEVKDDIPTACTDGINKYYGREFIGKLNDMELRALVLHENLHVALNHVSRFKRLFQENPMLMNACADYVVNDVIVHLKDENLCKLPEGGLYEDKYHNWSVKEVYDDLKEQLSNPVDDDDAGTGDATSDGNLDDQPGRGSKLSPDSLKTLDEHNFGDSEKSPKELKEMKQKVEDALKEGAILAGKFGANVPRAIEELFEPKIDWREVLREFIQQSIKGNDEYTWRRFNKRMMANDIYLPSMENETIGELVIAIDTSASIGQKELTEFATEVVSICDTVTPDRIRLLWWDYEVAKEQVFNQDSYQNIKDLLKPDGGGGTRVSCVSEYMVKHKIEPQACIVFTDGYVENDISWNIQSPTLWVVTENKHFKGLPGHVAVSWDNE